MKLSDRQVLGLVAALDATRDVEVDCEAYVGLMARLVQIRASGLPVPADLQLALEHEKLCASCREETRELEMTLEELEQGQR